MRAIYASIVAIIFSTSVMAQVTFSYAIPEQGTHKVEKKDFNMGLKIDVSVGGNVVQSLEQNQSKKTQKKEVVLDANSEAITKVEVTYVEEKEIQSNSMIGEQKMSAPVENKTYIVSRGEDGSLLVTDKEGNTPDQAELAIVEKEYGRFGQVDAMSKFFNGKTVKKGETIDVPKDIAGEVFGDEDALEIDTFSFTLAGVKKVGGMDCAVFDTVVVMSGNAAPGIQMTMNLKGQTLIGVSNSWPVAIDYNGTVKMDAKDPARNMEMTGGGDVNISVKAQYNKK